jgi:Sec-independent protein translocase protein TatA
VFGMGFGEMLVVGLLVIIFTRPEDLPILIRQAGRIYGYIMKIYYSFLDEINDISEDITKK